MGNTHYIANSDIEKKTVSSDTYGTDDGAILLFGPLITITAKARILLQYNIILTIATRQKGEVKSRKKNTDA